MRKFIPFTLEQQFQAGLVMLYKWISFISLIDSDSAYSVYCLTFYYSPSFLETKLLINSGGKSARVFLIHESF